MSDIFDRIDALKKEKNAVILAHYYQNMDVQRAADIVGDSFELARRAKEAEADVIVFCGVLFMAESAKILNPSRTVLLPVPDAGCPMADMIEPEHVLALRKKHPDAAVVCYVNSSAAVKAVSDVCCTSSSAVRICESLPEDEIIFIPDRNLGSYIAGLLPNKTFILYDGYCPTHDRISEDDVLAAKKRHPNAKFAVHPECRADVVAHADYVGSTKGILEYVETSAHGEFLIGTENGIIDRLHVTAPGKTVHMLTPKFVCPNMKKTKIEDVLASLENMRHEITLTPEAIQAALKPLERMIRL
ncbi:quinolinate synthase NadA [Oscillospiraceae bacterium OttesenSCG-928-G22]|nr:quinolinate synthase NadA [Oscillospiraceae bacterium OttesenSCG-928-G22]